MSVYVVAVSGGVDSVVLLDMLANKPEHKLIVAHFDHGIRPESAKDTEFVAGLAQKYGLPFETRREELGDKASEELARVRRYTFLRELAAGHGAKLVTAHHADDVIESIAINLLRGTGWRGLAVMDSDIERPLTNMTKNEIVYYAKQHDLEWREDHTNFQDNYLRNQVRRQTMPLDLDTKRQLLALWQEQKFVRSEIDREVAQLVEDPNYSRYFFTYISASEALECLRFATNSLLTRPQLSNALLAIKTFRSGKKFQAGSGVTLNFTTRNFTVELIK